MTVFGPPKIEKDVELFVRDQSLPKSALPVVISARQFLLAADAVRDQGDYNSVIERAVDAFSSDIIHFYWKLDFLGTDLVLLKTDVSPYAHRQIDNYLFYGRDWNIEFQWDRSLHVLHNRFTNTGGAITQMVLHNHEGYKRDLSLLVLGDLLSTEV